jgi:hypothetical protein
MYLPPELTKSESLVAMSNFLVNLTRFAAGYLAATTMLTSMLLFLLAMSGAFNTDSGFKTFTVIAFLLGAAVLFVLRRTRKQAAG